MDFVTLFDLTTLLNANGQIQYGNSAGQDSWNMEMAFINALVYNFDPFMPSSTGFNLRLMSAADAQNVRTTLAVSEITVNVPEPGSMALLGLGLVGIGAMARRRRQR